MQERQWAESEACACVFSYVRSKSPLDNTGVVIRLRPLTTAHPSLRQSVMFELQVNICVKAEEGVLRTGPAAQW